MEIKAFREFNEYGYVWYPTIWVATLNNWFELQWVRFQRPQGFASPDEAIRFAKEN